MPDVWGRGRASGVTGTQGQLPIGCPKTEKEVINNLDYPSPGNFSCLGRTNPSAKKSQLSLCLCLYQSVIVILVKRGSG
jgi:hypothetical protein